MRAHDVYTATARRVRALLARGGATAFLFVAIFLSVLGGCSSTDDAASNLPEEAEAIDSQKQAIINGVPNSGSPSIGYLANRYGQLFCTATLIRTNVILTAAHCQDAWYFVTDTGWYQIQQPSYASANYGLPRTAWSSFDWRIGVLYTDVVGIAPAKLSATGPSVSEGFYLIGFGHNYWDPWTGAQSGAGVKRIGANTVQRVGVAPNTFETAFSGAHIGAGDSGGPALVYRDGYWTVVGVASESSGPSPMWSRWTRVDYASGNYGALNHYVATYGQWQDNWLYCTKCKQLHYGPNAYMSRCAAGGQHNTTGSWNYSIPHSRASWTDGFQDDWRWCSKCQTLQYGPNAPYSACPGGGTHNTAGSWNYRLKYSAQGVYEPQQSEWRWCHKCQSLFYGPATAGSACPRGGWHDGSASYDYKIHHHSSAPL